MKRAGFLGPQYIMGHNRVITPKILKKMKETWVPMGTTDGMGKGLVVSHGLVHPPLFLIPPDSRRPKLDGFF